MKNDLSKVKVGDWIFTIADGWIKVDGIDYNYRFPIISAGDETYMIDGRVMPADAYPSAFTEPPEGFNAQPKPCEFVKGQRVIVSDHYSKTLPRVQRAYFSHVEDGMYYCFVGGGTEWSKNGRTEPWKYCCHPAEEEE